MLCPRCYGKGQLPKIINFNDEEKTDIPMAVWKDIMCEECNGCGVVNCCEGLRDND